MELAAERKMKINLIYNKIPHHASHSGYDQLARYLVDKVATNNLESDVPKWIPWPVWSWMADRFGPWISARSRMDWYDIWGLSLEIGAGFQLMKGNGSIYHLLYGENSYRHLGSLRSLARRKGSRIIASYHQPPEVFERVVRCKSILKKLDAIIAVSQNQASYFASFVGDDKVFVVPHGVDTDYFCPIEKEESNGRQCVFVGQWLRDFEMMRAVVANLGARDAQVKFKIITSEDKASVFNGARNIEVLNSISDAQLLEAYQTADMLVLPLTDCTANNSLLEGLACGLPVVTTDVGGVRDYVDSSCARIVRSGDVNSMSEAILTLASDGSMRSEMGKQSRRQALTYDWALVSGKLLSVYEKVAA